MITLQGSAFEKLMDQLERTLIKCLLETGYAHIELECSMINREKDIVRVELTAGAKHSFTVSRKEVLARARIN
jgi:hypothetical protein